MKRSQRFQVWLYGGYLKLTPPDHQVRHRDDQLRLFSDLVATGHRPSRLWIGAIADLVTLYRTNTRRSVMSDLARLALYPLSLLNTVAGLTLAALAISTDAVPVWVAAPAVAVGIQGVYSLVWLQDRVPLPPARADLLFAWGEAAALVSGVVGLTTALVAQNGTPDPEYGPPTMLSLVAVHALIGLMSSRLTHSGGAPAIR